MATGRPIDRKLPKRLIATPTDNGIVRSYGPIPRRIALDEENIRSIPRETSYSPRTRETSC